jgi:hypothetical protein
MIRKAARLASFPCPALLPVVGVLLLVACESTKPGARPAATAAPKATPVPTRVEQLVTENRGLEEGLAKEQTARKALEDQVARYNLRLLEKDTQIKELKDRQAELQAKLDEAILEVVRAKGKLRSLESRAEAASNMAEAEIALKSLEGQVHGTEAKKEELTQAEQLLKMSAAEFKKENYGGALYLANEAKSRLRGSGARAAGQGGPEAAPGESVFATPLSLQVVSVCNLREGPGTEFKAVATLQKGAKVQGYAQKGRWLRVKEEGGSTGWVFESLVARR